MGDLLGWQNTRRGCEPANCCQCLWANHAVAPHMRDLLQPAYSACGAIVDSSIKYQKRQRAWQAIPFKP